MSFPLDVFADLRLIVEGEPIDIRGTGDRIVFDLPNLQAGWHLLSSGPFAHNRGQTTSRIHDVLQMSEVTAEVHLRGDSVARLGEEARPGLLEQLLDLDGVEIRPLSSIWSVLRQRPLVAAGIILGLLLLVGWWLLRD